MNKLFYGDNLRVLRDSVTAESVDLIYLDPPFNSKRDYNLLFKSPKAPAGGEAAYSAAQIEAFEDTWHWTQDVTEAEYDQLHRVLKPTGSLYLHCDPTASHYLKIVLDAVFGKENIRNEIIWRRTRAHNDKKISKYGAIHDTLFYYAKDSAPLFNVIRTERD